MRVYLSPSVEQIDNSVYHAFGILFIGVNECVHYDEIVEQLLCEGKLSRNYIKHLERFHYALKKFE